MQHLTTEALARLVDETPAATERDHLEGCATCRAELDALCEQTRELGRLPTLQPPAGGWDRVQARLACEGLIDSGTSPVTRRFDWAWARQLPRIAAGVALFLAGGVAGAALTEGGSSPLTALRGEPEGGPAEVRTVAEAAETLERTETAYLAALSQYAELTGEPSSPDVATRLATLESIVLTTRAALDEAPADPVINNYHLTALGQRNAMLQQIAQESQDPWF